MKDLFDWSLLSISIQFLLSLFYQRFVRINHLLVDPSI